MLMCTVVGFGANTIPIVQIPIFYCIISTSLRSPWKLILVNCVQVTSAVS